MESSASDEGDSATPSFKYRIALFSLLFLSLCIHQRKNKDSGSSRITGP